MQTRITTLKDGKQVEIRETKRAVTPYGGLSVWVAFLERIGYMEAMRSAMPFELHSPNAIPPEETLTGFLFGVLAGARRFAQTGILRLDKSVHRLAGIARFPTDDTIRNIMKRFGMSQVQHFFGALWAWQLKRLPARANGYTLDLDSTVFERYGCQEGAKKGHNPKKRGRPSHHPLVAVLAEAYFVLHGWLRSGNCSAGRGAVEFLKEALAQLPAGVVIRCVRGDAGFFDDELLSFLEERELSYIIVARLTSGVKGMVGRVNRWREIDTDYAAGEFRAQLLGWRRERRFVVIRERIREGKHSVGRKLIDIPGYSYRIFVTAQKSEPEEVWRDYNQRADMEKRIAELKYDLAADDFCLKQFYATETAFRLILMLFNLLAEFQRALGFTKYRQPATLRTQIFLCGAILGRAGHRIVLHLSSCWGGLQTRKPLLDRLLLYLTPTSAKLAEGCVS